MFTDLTTGVELAHGLAREKGWYDEGPRSIPELLMLVVSELTEARRAAMERGDMREVWHLDSGKPEGFGIELADAAIRVLDMAGAYQLPLSVNEWGKLAAPWFAAPSLNGGVLDLVDDLSDALEAHRKNDRDWTIAALERFMGHLWTYAMAWGIPLAEHMAEKHAFNRTRPYRHGGKAL